MYGGPVSAVTTRSEQQRHIYLYMIHTYHMIRVQCCNKKAYIDVQ